MADKKLDFSAFDKGLEEYDLEQEETAQELDFSAFDEGLKQYDLEQKDVEAFITGAGQGLTFGFGDEIQGGIETAIGKFTDLFRDEDSKLYKGSFSDEYKEARDEYRENNRELREANPWAYGGGEFAGGALTTAIPGFGAAKSGKLLANVGKAVLEGGLYGAGSSEGETIEEVAGDAAKGAAISGAFSGAISGTGKLINKFGNKVDDLANPNIDDLADRFSIDDQRVIDRIKTNPQRIKEIVEKGDFNPDELGSYIADTLKKNQDELGQQVAKFRQAALKNNDQLVYVNPALRELIDEVDQAVTLRGKKVLPAQLQKNIDLIRDVVSDQNISPSDAVKTVDLIDSIIDYGNLDRDGSSFIRQADLGLQKIRSTIKDSVRDLAPEWYQADQTFARFKDASRGLINKFSGDQRASAVSNLFSKNKEPIQQRLAEALDIIDPDTSQLFFDEILDQKAASQILSLYNQKVDPVQDKLSRTLQDFVSSGKGPGGIIGGVLGSGFGPFGAAAGAYAGNEIGEQVANTIGKKLNDPTRVLKTAIRTQTGQPKNLDRFIKVLQGSPEVFGKYAAPLQRAAQRGGRALAVSLYVLQKQSPEFNEMYQQIEKDED